MCKFCVSILQSYPSFSYEHVTPDNVGADIVRTYSTVDYPVDRKQLQDMGKSDLLISLVTAVCSNIHLIEVSYCFKRTIVVLNQGYEIISYTHLCGVLFKPTTLLLKLIHMIRSAYIINKSTHIS